jgi:hypothetical protein
MSHDRKAIHHVHLTYKAQTHALPHICAYVRVLAHFAHTIPGEVEAIPLRSCTFVSPDEEAEGRAM